MALVTTVVVNVLSLVLALGLNSKIRFKSTLRGLYFVPNILGALVVGYIFNYFFTYIVPALISMTGGQGTSILASEKWAWVAIVIVCAWQAVAMNTIIYISGLQTVPEDVYEAGSIDGATGWSQFKHLTFPLIIPFFSINMVLCVKNFLMVFDQIMALTKGGPAQSTESISYLIYNNEELNRLLDENLLTYDFQPIVDAASGKVFGYEALMRSQLPTLPSTDEILSLARAQSKLHLIERRTWQNALKGFSELPERVDDCYLFINSLPNQILSPEIVRELEKRYPDLLPRIVIELTEKEPQNDRYMRDKLQLAQKWGAKIALDGFGAGYSNDDMLLQIEPDFIKINMKLIRDIDIDTKHHQFLESILSYTKERGIRSIAEGIETSTEMETLIRSGVDYLQGFYIGRPEAGSSEIAPSICEEIHSINCQPPEP